MHTQTQTRIPRLEIADVLFGCSDVKCTLHVMSFLIDPIDLIRAAAVSHNWRHFGANTDASFWAVIEHGLCRRLFFERFPHVTHVVYEVEGRYQIIRLSDVLIGDTDEWVALERAHRIYSYLFHTESKRMDCPRDCLLFPVGASSTRGIAENILTKTSPVCRYPVGYSFLSLEEQSETCIDFLQCLESDVCISIMSFLDDPADIVRVSAVSRFWRQFAMGLAKQKCLKLFPELSTIGSLINGRIVTTSSTETGTSTSIRSEYFVRDDTVTLYASLLEAITKWNVSQKDCVLYGISASSTDNFPAESIGNTLYPRDTFMGLPSYWSSKGHSDPEVPETLLYRLKKPVSVITEFDIQPFKAIFERGGPIYSAKSVRFRMGHPKSRKVVSNELQYLSLEKPYEDKFVWTYTSPVFPMMQESNIIPMFLDSDECVGAIQAARTGLCLGGYVQVELLGRVQRQESNGLFYLCMSHVRVVGRPLSPAFEVEIHEPSEEILLRYYPQLLGSIMQESDMSHMVHVQEVMLWERIGYLVIEPVLDWGVDDDDALE